MVPATFAINGSRHENAFLPIVLRYSSHRCVSVRGTLPKPVVPDGRIASGEPKTHLLRL